MYGVVRKIPALHFCIFKQTVHEYWCINIKFTYVVLKIDSLRIYTEYTHSDLVLSLAFYFFFPSTCTIYRKCNNANAFDCMFNFFFSPCTSYSEVVYLVDVNYKYTRRGGNTAMQLSTTPTQHTRLRKWSSVSLGSGLSLFSTSYKPAKCNHYINTQQPARRRDAGESSFRLVKINNNFMCVCVCAMRARARCSI